MNATSSAPSKPGDNWRHGLLVFFLVLLFSVPQAALLPLLDRDEPRFAEASREMLQSGNIVVPMFNHAPRYAKPPLIYWCQALSYSAFGENAFAARLPSLLATAGTAWLLFAWGVSLGSRCIGMIAGLAYPFCLQTIQQGRVATADALLIFFMTLTAFAGWKLITGPAPASRSSRSYFWDSILAVGFAGGFLAKGPEALLPFLPMLFCARGNGRRLTMELTVNFLLGLALVLFWAIPAYIETNGDYWRVGMSEGVGQRMVSGLQGHGASTFGWYLLSIPLYLLLFWISALPWSPLLLTHRKKLFTGWKLDLTDTYLLLNVGLIFLVFSLMVTKLPHYTLPAFPFIALLLARRWEAAGLSPVLPAQLCGGLGLLFAVLTSVLVPIAIAHHATPSPVSELVRDARGSLTPDTEFALVDFREPNAIWEMRRAVKTYGQTIPDSQVLSFLNQPGPRAVVLSTALWHQVDWIEFDDTAHHIAPPWKTFEARGLNAAKLGFIDITLVVKP